MGWLNDMIEQFWERCLRPHVTPDLVNNKLSEIQRSVSVDDPVMAELLSKLKVISLKLSSNPLVISKIEVDGGTLWTL